MAINLPMDKIVKEFESRIEQKKLAENYGVSQATISQRLTAYYQEKGIPKPKFPKKSTKKPLPIEEIVKQREAGRQLIDIAGDYGVSATTISKRLAEYYNSEDKGNENAEAEIEETLPINKVVEQFESGTKVEKLACDYNVSAATINRELNKYYAERGIERPKVLKSAESAGLDISEIIKQYEDGESVQDIADGQESYPTKVRRYINRYYASKNMKTPKILTEDKYVVDYLKKGLSIEDIIKVAKSLNIIIPPKIIESALQQVHKNNTEPDTLDVI